MCTYYKLFYNICQQYFVYSNIILINYLNLKKICFFRVDKYKKESILLLKNYRCFTNLIRKSVRIRYSPHYCEADESTQNH